MFDFNMPGVMPALMDQNQGDPNAGTGISMIDPASIQLAMQNPMPQPAPEARRPSLIDRILERLYPAEGLGAAMSPDTLADERRLALRRAGLSLLAGAGPRPLNAPPHNFGADLAQALDPSAWTQQLEGTAKNALQLSAMQKKMDDDQKFKAIMAANQPQPNETPKQLEARVRNIASQSLAAGLMEHAQVASKMIDELRPAKTETELHKMPDGSTQLIDKADGSVIKTWAAGEMPILTPEQKVQNTLAYRKEFESQMAPVKAQLDAYKAYRAAPAGPASDALRLANAIKVVVPSAGVTAQQVLSGEAENFGGIPIIGPLIKAFDTKGNLDPAARAALDAYVEQQMQTVRANGTAVLKQHQALAESVGLDPNDTTYDPFAGEQPRLANPKDEPAAKKIRRLGGTP